MKFEKHAAELFIPDKAPLPGALTRTTHICFAAHQDDVEIMAYGPVVECYGRDDKWFSAVILTDGAGSPRSGVYEKYTDEEMKTVRVKEQKNASVIGEYAAQFLLARTSGEIKDKNNTALIDELVSILKECRPQIVYTHNLADKHDTHVSVALRVIQAIRALPANERPERVIALEVWRGLDWVNDDEKVVLDTSGHQSLSAALLGVFDSQITGGKRYDLATAGRRLANATYYASHDVDDCESMSFGIDITDAVFDAEITPGRIIDKYIDSFRKDVSDRIGRFA